MTTTHQEGFIYIIVSNYRSHCCSVPLKCGVDRIERITHYTCIKCDKTIPSYDIDQSIWPKFAYEIFTRDEWSGMLEIMRND